MNKAQLFMKASRMRVIPIMLIPVILGAIASYVWEGIFHPLLLLITLIGSACAHLFSNMINDLWDYRSGVDTAAKETTGAISTNSGFLANGVMKEKTFAVMTWTLFAIGMLCAVILSLISGWWAFILGVLGALIAYFYVGPPLRFGYRGKGYSEIAIVISFGVLPIAGSYYVQTGGFDYRAILLALPIGILTTLILFNHHFLHWKADKETGKNTLVVVWGEAKALQLSKTMAIIAYATLLLCIILGVLPWYGIVALLTSISLYRAYGQLQPTNPSPAYLALMQASLLASIRCGAIMMIVLLIEGLIF